MTNCSIDNRKIVWIAWEKHRRTIEICHFLKITPTFFTSDLPRLIKHPMLIAKTILFLFTNRPNVVIVQNPSIVLTWIGCIFKNILNYFFVVDAHNGGIIPESTIGKKISALYRSWPQKTDLTIVTNSYLSNVIKKGGGTPFILPDKLPDVKVDKPSYPVEGKINILCVSTFDTDEPYEEIFKAAEKLPKDIVIYMTGNSKKIPSSLLKKKPDKIRLTGFLCDTDYWELLASVDLVMDLTTRENCLVCGAYEAVSQNKPVILSDTRVLREYFTKGAIFTSNDSASIYHTVLAATKKTEELASELSKWIPITKLQWTETGSKLASILRENIYD